MGKVASVAIEKGLQRTLPDADVRRLHFMSEPRLAHFVELLEHARDTGDAPFGAMTSIVEQVRFGAETREWVAEHLAAGRRITVVTGVRDPVDFAVAAFFQVLDFVSPLAADLYRVEPGWVATLQAAFIDFWTRALAGDPCLTSADRQILPLFTLPQRWFEEELQPFLGMDVYAEPFDAGTGWTVRRTDQVDLLLFRFEDARRVLPAALGELLWRPRVPLDVWNATDDKPTAALHRAFRETLRAPRVLLAAAYATRYARHFYTDGERAALTTRWSRRHDAGRLLQAQLGD
jgi:hypothetical protein